MMVTFKSYFPQLDKFLNHLIDAIQQNRIKDWREFENEVSKFFTPGIIEQIDQIIPGWQKMASYANGVTLVHVVSVMVALRILPDYQQATSHQKALSEWIALFHDIEKEVKPGKRDNIHGFLSAATTAKLLPTLGFETTENYADTIDDWIALTNSAKKYANDRRTFVQDNQKLPDIQAGINQLFRENTPAALIVKGVLLHMSINGALDWPQAAPLSEDEIKRFLDGEFLPLLELIMLADSDAWSLFSEDIKEQQRENIHFAIRNIKKFLQP